MMGTPLMMKTPMMYADMFTFSCFLLFGYHFVTTWYLSFDPDVAFFIGQWQLLGLLWAPLFGVAHFLHVRRKQPWRGLMMACIFPAAATFFVIAWGLLFKAERIGMLLRSAECTRAPEVQELHLAALAAREFHKRCLEAAAPEYKLIQFCNGYDEMLKESGHQAGWEYLSYAEHNYACAGFCNEDAEPSMWTYQGYQDTCAVAVANVFETKVAKLCYQEIFVAVLQGCLFLAWIELMSPTLRALERGEKPVEESHPILPDTPGAAYQSYGGAAQQPAPVVVPPSGTIARMPSGQPVAMGQTMGPQGTMLPPPPPPQMGNAGATMVR